MKAFKLDEGKPDLSLFPKSFIFGVGKALTYGEKKYTKNGISGAYNYKRGKGLKWLQVVSALLRHLFAWIGGEEMDEESGLKHLWHMGACAVMLIDLTDSNIGEDTRFIGSN